MALHLRSVSLLPMLLCAGDQKPAASSGDWPGLWGPFRNGTTSAVVPASPSKTESIWRRPTAGGYSEIAIHDGLAFTMELRDGADFVVALEALTGRERWSVRVGPTYRGHGGSDDGPISTPAVAGRDLFALGPHGVLIAIDVVTGKERWRHDLVKDFSAAAPTWGFAASPLIEGGLVIIPTGGPDSQGLLAFDRATGQPAWHAAVAKATAYTSAVTATIGGVRQVVAVASDRIFAVSPDGGRVLWSAPGPGGTVEMSNSPFVLPGDRVLVNTWEQSVLFGIAAREGEFEAREIWRSPRLRESNGPIVHRDGFLYGFVGPQLICMNAETAEIAWRERTGPGTLIAVGDRLVLLSQDTGELQMATISPKGFARTHTARVLEPGVRAVTGPSFADGRLYVRNLKEIVALRVQ
jgi:outer membrane protein assembly factor BamB